MNWKEEAMGKLRKFEAVRRSLISIPQEIARLEEASGTLSGGTLSRTSGSRNVRAREQSILNNLAMRQELQWSLEQANRWMETVSKALGVLAPQQRQLLYLFYIRPEPGNLEQACRELKLEKSSVYRHRDKALEQFALAMYGATESI